MVRLFLLLTVGIAAISTASILIKLCDAPALIISAYRVGVASLLLMPWAIHRTVRRQWKPSSLPWCILSGFFLSFHFAFWIASLSYTSVASSVVLVTTTPVFVGFGAWLLLKEPLTRPLVLAIALSVLGSGLIGYGDMAISRNALFGDGLALLGAVMASGYLLVGRKMRKDRDLFSYVFPVYFSAAVLLIGVSLLFRKPFFGYSSSTYLLLFLLALIPQLLGHTTFNWSLKYLPASTVSIAILGEPVGSTLLAFLFLGETLTLWKVLGGISIFSGIIIAMKRAPGTQETRERSIS